MATIKLDGHCKLQIVLKRVCMGGDMKFKKSFYFFRTKNIENSWSYVDLKLIHYFSLSFFPLNSIKKIHFEKSSGRVR